MKFSAHQNVFFVLLLVGIFNSNQLFAQRGKNGPLTVNTANTIVNAYTALTADAAAGTNTIVVANNSLSTHFSSSLAAGDLIIIMQMQGASIRGTNTGGIDNTTDSTWGMVTTYNNCGNWELAQVNNVSGSTNIMLDCPLAHAYTATGKTQVIRIPRYTSLTITSPGVVTCDAWNGSVGGVCTIEVENNTVINTGSFIDVSGKGFRGGQVDNTSHSPLMNLFFQASGKPEDGAEKGEGIAGYNTDYDPYGGHYMRGAPANGGGGGNIHNGGGGGGANGGDNSTWNGHGIPDLSIGSYTNAWNLQYANFASQVSSGGGQGGYAWSAANLDPTVVAPCDPAWSGQRRCAMGGYGGRPLDYSTGKLFLGGGGGAGDQDNNVAGNGGAGGGLIYFINYGSISGSGQLIAGGNFGTNSGKDGAGGGGGGGTIVVNSIGTPSSISGISIMAQGGKGGDQSLTTTEQTQAEGPGGGGGGGVILLSKGSPTMGTSAGVNGTTNTACFNIPYPNGPNQFPPNGATKGADGSINTVAMDGILITASSATICAGQSATLNASLSGTIPGGTNIVWYDTIAGGNSIGSGGTYTTPVISTAGTYTYYVGSCPGIYREPATVTVKPAPVIVVSPDTGICVGESVTLSASGGTSYVWSNGVSASAITVAPTTNSAYTVNAGTSCGIITATVAVTINPSVKPTLSGNTSICAGSNTTLTASGGVNYIWSTTETTSSILVSPSTTTTYSLNVSNGKCSMDTSITVNVTKGIIASITSNNTTVCPGSSTTLVASGGNNYIWSTTETTASILVAPTITSGYSVTAFSGACSSVATFTITVSNTGVNANISGPTNICNGGNAILIASGGDAYQWSTGKTDTSITVTPTTTTTYSVLVYKGTCTGTASFTVNVSSSITASITGNTTICGSTTSILSASGGSSYAWSTGASTANISIAPAPSSITTYTVIASSGLCKDTATVTVNTLPIVITSITGNTNICQGTVSTLTALVNVGNNNSYVWSTGETTSIIMVSPTVTSTYSVSGASGICSDTALITVTVIPQASATVSPNTTICSGQSILLTVSGGTVYTWSNGDHSSAIMVTPLTNSTYSVIAGVSTCSDTGFVSVAVMPTPTVNVSGNTTICMGDVITLNASGGSTYNWSNGTSASAITVSPANSTTYSVIATTAMCNDTGKVTVAVSPTPTASITGNNICQGSVGTITASGGGNYLWNTGETTAVIHPTAAGNYSVLVSIGTCRDSAIKSMTVNSNPIANASSDMTITQGQSADLSATGGKSYTWNNNMTGANITVFPSATTQYCVTVYDANTCHDSTCVTVVVELCSDAGTLYLPNAFSPNGDGENDNLQIYYSAISCIKKFHLALYNRWGEKVYETSDPGFKWNGVYNAGAIKNRQTGGSEVYAYYLRVEIANGTKISKQGNISLIR